MPRLDGLQYGAVLEHNAECHEGYDIEHFASHCNNRATPKLRMKISKGPLRVQVMA